MEKAAEKAEAENEAAAGRAPGSESKDESPEHKKKRLARTMEYVGRRSVGKFGCFGCHDIPGYEDAKTIGTGLADWGRKDPSRLAFEEIIEYVTHHPDGMHPGGFPKSKPAAKSAAAMSVADAASKPAAKPAAIEDQPELSLDDLPSDIGFFMNELLEEDRTGFLWQKLRAPRSYDFRKTGERSYNVRLRMPQFTFAPSPKRKNRSEDGAGDDVRAGPGIRAAAGRMLAKGGAEGGGPRQRAEGSSRSSSTAPAATRWKWIAWTDSITSQAISSKPPKTVDYPMLNIAHYTAQKSPPRKPPTVAAT